MKRTAPISHLLGIVVCVAALTAIVTSLSLLWLLRGDDTAESTVDRTAMLSKSSHRVDVREYGAPSDGATSAHEAILRALNDPKAPSGSHDRGRVVSLTAGDYLVDKPIQLKENQGVYVGPDARLLVPQGYADAVFLVGDGAQARGVSIQGQGHVSEIGKGGGKSTAPGAWTFVKFHGSGNGVAMSEVSGLTVWWPGTFVSYEADSRGWVNGVNVSDTVVFYPRVLLETTTRSKGTLGYNKWSDVRVQVGTHTSHGIKVLRGRGWFFEGLVLWDIHNSPTMEPVTISADAQDTLFIGGSIARNRIVDRSRSTSVVGPGGHDSQNRRIECGRDPAIYGRGQC
jgi:hypothetical protein